MIEYASAWTQTPGEKSCLKFLISSCNIKNIFATFNFYKPPKTAFHFCFPVICAIMLVHMTAIMSQHVSEISPLILNVQMDQDFY